MRLRAFLWVAVIIEFGLLVLAGRAIVLSRRVIDLQDETIRTMELTLREQREHIENLKAELTMD